MIENVEPNLLPVAAGFLFVKGHPGALKFAVLPPIKSLFPVFEISGDSEIDLLNNSCLVSSFQFFTSSLNFSTILVSREVPPGPGPGPGPCPGSSPDTFPGPVNWYFAQCGKCLLNLNF